MAGALEINQTLPWFSITDRLNRIPSTDNKWDAVLSRHVTESNLQVNSRQDNYARPKSTLVLNQWSITLVPIDWRPKSSSVKQQSANTQSKEAEVKQGGSPNEPANIRSSNTRSSGGSGKLDRRRHRQQTNSNLTKGPRNNRHTS